VKSDTERRETLKVLMENPRTRAKVLLATAKGGGLVIASYGGKVYRIRIKTVRATEVVKRKEFDMKLFLKKAWIFVRTYWYIFVGILVAIVAIVMGGSKDVSKIFDLVREERETAKKEIEIIETVHEKEREELRKNREKNTSQKNDLSEKYKEDKEKLEKIQKNAVDILVNDLAEDPNKTLAKIAKEMGWDHDK